MPFKSESQRRFFYAAEDRGELPKGTAARWQRHTPKGKKLPEHVGDKKAFVTAFLTKCAAEGITAPADVAASAEQLAAVCEDLVKSAAYGTETIGSALGGGLGTWATTGTIGSLVLPAGIGMGLGAGAAQIRNKSDDDDAEALRIAALAAAYRRRAAEAKTQDQVRQLVASDPSKYVVMG